MGFFLFPWMHPESLGFQLPAKVKLLDAGAAGVKTGGASFYRPPQLPLSEAETRKYILQVQELEGQVKSVQDLASRARASQEDFFSQTSMGVRSDFSRYTSDTQDEEDSLRRQAQMMLLLFWAMEETLIDFSSLEDKVDALWQTYEQVLGLNHAQGPGGRAEEETRGLKIESVFTGAFNWDKLLPWFLFFMPEEGALIVFDSPVEQSWLELGLSPREVSSADIAAMGGWDPLELDRGGHEFRAPGWQLCLMSRPLEDKTWLNTEVTAVTCAA